MAATRTAMDRGAPLIAQAAHADSCWIGYADVLVRVEGAGAANPPGPAPGAHAEGIGAAVGRVSGIALSEAGPHRVNCRGLPDLTLCWDLRPGLIPQR